MLEICGNASFSLNVKEFFFMEFIFLISILLIALLYSSVGHGGASGYMALMVIFGISPLAMRSSVLCMNLLVSSISFIHFYNAGYFRYSLLWPFAITSIPFTFIGSILPFHTKIFKILLVIYLLIGIFRLLFIHHRNFKISKPFHFPTALILGVVIGLTSGIVGIGGGIILSPLILFLGWGNAKETAAVSAVFIFLNSCAGLLGSWFSKQIILTYDLWYCTFFVIIGAILGSRLGSFYWKFNILNYILSIVLLIALIKLFI